MANGFIELDAMSGGDKIDAETLTVASSTVFRERIQVAGSLDTEIAKVLAVPIATDAFGLGVRRITDRSSIVSLFSAQAINATTFAVSAKNEVDQYLKAMIYVSVIRSATPPDKLIVTPQFSDDDGTTYFNDEANVVEITDMTAVPTSVGYNFVMKLDLLGRDFILRLDGENTDGTKTFTVDATVEFIK